MYIPLGFFAGRTTTNAGPATCREGLCRSDAQSVLPNCAPTGGRVRSGCQSRGHDEAIWRIDLPVDAGGHRERCTVLCGFLSQPELHSQRLSDGRCWLLLFWGRCDASCCGESGSDWRRRIISRRRTFLRFARKPSSGSATDQGAALFWTCRRGPLHDG